MLFARSESLFNRGHIHDALPSHVSMHTADMSAPLEALAAFHGQRIRMEIPQLGAAHCEHPTSTLLLWRGLSFLRRLQHRRPLSPVGNHCQIGLAELLSRSEKVCFFLSFIYSPRRLAGVLFFNASSYATFSSIDIYTQRGIPVGELRNRPHVESSAPSAMKSAL